MPPLSSTKHVHGTEAVAPRGENRAFLPPHHYAEEFLSEHASYIPGCLFTARALHLHSSAITVCIQSWEPGLRQHTADFHVSSLHISGLVPDGREEGLYSRVQHPSSSAVQSTGTSTAETDRSESKKQRLQIRRLTALILHVLSAGKRGVSVILKTLSPITCNSDMNLGHTWMEAG